MPPKTDFGKGVCECGNSLWQTFKEKYKFAQIVKNGRDTIAWQWLCKQCGAVHHEPCKIIVHMIAREEAASIGAD